jgi:hypothetical protein
MTLRAEAACDSIREDPWFAEMLELLDADVKYTPRFLQDQGLAGRGLS